MLIYGRVIDSHQKMVIPGSARPALGRKFRKIKITLRIWWSISFWDAEATNCWSCEVHQRSSKWWLSCEWHDMKESVHNWMNEWVNEPMNRWTNEAMNQCLRQSMKQWSSKAMTRWINQPVNQWINGSVNQWTNAPVNQWTNEAMNRWFSETMNQWINAWMI